MNTEKSIIPAASGFFGGLLCGVGIGVALMYILDPENGADRRSMIKDKASTWGNDGLAWGGKAVDGIKSTAETYLGKAKESVPSASSIPTSFQSIQ